MVSRTLTAFCKWILAEGPRRSSAPPQPTGRQRCDAFFADLHGISRQIAQITHAFFEEGDRPVGYVQLHRSGGEVTIHRIWTVRPGQGHGSMILGRLCELADRHGVSVALKVVPLGAKPYPMSAAQLRDWYERYGFRGEKKLIRPPAAAASFLERELAPACACG